MTLDFGRFDVSLFSRELHLGQPRSKALYVVSPYYTPVCPNFIGDREKPFTFFHFRVYPLE